MKERLRTAVWMRGSRVDAQTNWRSNRKLFSTRIGAERWKFAGGREGGCVRDWIVANIPG